MYAEDSFFTLCDACQVGLAVVSLCLGGACLLGVRYGLSRLRRPWRIIAALAVFWVFLWLSPQVYYAYYRLIIPGLPGQWVIGAPPGPGQILRVLLFSQAATLSAHGLAVLGWAMIAMAAIMPRRSELTHT